MIKPYPQSAWARRLLLTIWCSGWSKLLSRACQPPIRSRPAPIHSYKFMCLPQLIHFFLRGKDPLTYLYCLLIAHSLGLDSYHSRFPLSVCQLGQTFYAAAQLLSTRGKFTRCYFAKNIPLRRILCLVICNSSFPKPEECWKKSSSKWHFSTLKMSAQVLRTKLQSVQSLQENLPQGTRMMSIVHCTWFSIINKGL